MKNMNMLNEDITFIFFKPSAFALISLINIKNEKDN